MDIKRKIGHYEIKEPSHAIVLVYFYRDGRATVATNEILSGVTGSGIPKFWEGAT